MKTGSSLDTFIELHHGDHLCCLYETDEERRVVLATLLLQGLERGEKTCLIGDMRSSQALLDHMEDHGFEVSPYLSSGQFSVMSFDETYMRAGVFDSDKMIELSRIVADDDGNLENVVYDATDLEMWVAYANGSEIAGKRPYVYIDLKKYFD